MELIQLPPFLFSVLTVVVFDSGSYGNVRFLASIYIYILQVHICITHRLTSMYFVNAIHSRDTVQVCELLIRKIINYLVLSSEIVGGM